MKHDRITALSNQWRKQVKLKDNLDPKYSRISLYVIGTSLIVYILFLIVGNFSSFVGVIGSGIGWLMTLLTPVFWAFMLAYLLKPLCDWIEKNLRNTAYYRKKNGRGTRTMSVTLTCILVLVALILLFSMIISAVSSELQVASIDSIVAFFNSFADSIKSLYDDLLIRLNSVNISSETVQSYVSQFTAWMGKWVAGLGDNLFSSATKISSFVTNLLFTVIFSIYFMGDGDHIKSYWGRVYHVLFGDRATAQGKEFLSIADRVFSGYFRGQMIDALFMMIIISVSLSLVGVKFSVIIGVLAGIGNLIPYVGPFVAYTATILVCLINGSWVKMIIALIVLFIVQGIDGNIVNPKLLGANVNIHPLYVIISLIIGEASAGLIGMLFAVPIAALIKELFDHLVNQMMQKRREKQEQLTSNSGKK
ncbi:MAG: AI-2E family transporter [Erysipelotrichia bacterium]|nr:AI-2E family transporter [Erysipelotrichia bacterium]